MFIKKPKAIIHKSTGTSEPTRTLIQRQKSTKKSFLKYNTEYCEVSSRFSKADRRNFYVIARGSVFECLSIFDFMTGENLPEDNIFKDLYSKSEELSKMIFAMINSQSDYFNFVHYYLPYSKASNMPLNE